MKRFVAMWAFVLLLASAAGARAADAQSSLELVPADAQVYISARHLGEHVDAIAASRWWAAAKESSIAKRIALRDDDHSPPAEMIRGVLADPQNLELMLFARELGSQEVFAYTDRRIFDLNDLYTESAENLVIGYMGIGVMFSSGDFDFMNAENIMTDILLGPVMENLDKIAVPNVVVGFKLKNPAGAEKILARQLDRLRPLLKGAGLPEPSDQIAEEEIAGAKTWVWKFEGNAIPWAGMMNIHGDTPAAVETLLQHLQNLKASVTLSVRRGYLIMTIGDGASMLSKLGNGPLLADADELAPLKKADASKLTGVVYTSKLANASLSVDAGDLKAIVARIRHTMQAIGSDEAKIKTVTRGVKEITDDLASLLPKPGGKLTMAQTTAEGIEFTTHDYGEPLYADGSKPLTILDHVGEAPLAVFAGRTKSLEESYRTLAKCVTRSYEMIETHLIPALPAEASGPFGQFSAAVKPVVKKFDRAMRDLWLPALADGQSALVLDARVSTPMWGPELPPGHFPLAAPLPALVVSVKDADQLRAGIDAMRDVVNEAGKRLSDFDSTLFDEWKLEEPKSREFPGGTIYWHTLPREAMLDKRIAPNYGLGEKVAVFSLVPLHTQALLAATKNKLPAPLDVRDQPLAGAVHIDVAQSVELAATWTAYFSTMPRMVYETRTVNDADGSSYRTTERRAIAPPQAAIEAAEGVIKDIAKLSKAVPSYTSATKVVDGKLVTRGVLRIVDLPAEKK
jgi:hypothetical protein